VSSEEEPEQALLAELSAEPSKPEHVSPAPASSVTRTPAGAEATPRSDRPAPPRTELHAGLGAVWGSLPEPALATTLGIARRLGHHVWVGGSLRALPPLREQPLAPGQSVTVQAYDGAALQGCLGRPFRAHMLIRLCAGPELNVWAARGRALTSQRQPRSTGLV
jgi:hypothetical protein